LHNNVFQYPFGIVCVARKPRNEYLVFIAGTDIAAVLLIQLFNQTLLTLPPHTVFALCTDVLLWDELLDCHDRYGFRWCDGILEVGSIHASSTLGGGSR